MIALIQALVDPNLGSGSYSFPSHCFFFPGLQREKSFLSSLLPSSPPPLPPPLLLSISLGEGGGYSRYISETRTHLLDAGQVGWVTHTRYYITFTLTAFRDSQPFPDRVSNFKTTHSGKTLRPTLHHDPFWKHFVTHFWVANP